MKEIASKVSQTSNATSRISESPCMGSPLSSQVVIPAKAGIQLLDPGFRRGDEQG
jgi:hypothetical protein